MKKRVYAYLHTHWDREWYRDKEDFNLRLSEVFDTVINELKSGNAPFFYMDGQTIALLDYLQFKSEKKDEIINLIKEKKLAIGPYFVSADSYLTNFCSMLKNLDIGLKYSKEFKQKDFIGYLCDIFGISKSVFCALNLKNINKAIIWRGVNPKKINNYSDFLYDNIKTHWLAQGYFNDFFHYDRPNIENIEKYIDKIAKYSKNSILLPIGGDHLNILKNANKKIDEINKLLKGYEIVLTSPFEYFQKAEFKNEKTNIEFLDNSHTYILQGVYSARIPQKIRNNNIQNELSRIIEPLNFYLKDKYEKNIDYIWETLLKNHAHDGIYGCSLDSVQKAVDARFDKCENSINAIKKRIIGNFKKKYKISGKTNDKIGLFNLSNCDNIKIIKFDAPYIVKNAQVIDVKESFSDELLYDINKIPVTEDICKIYTQVAEVSSNKKFNFQIVKIKKPKNKVKITEKSIENKNIALFIKNNRIEIINKKNNSKVYLKLTDINDIGDSYNFAPLGKSREYELKSTKINYKGEIESCLELNFKDIKLCAVLNNESEFLRFNFEINNKKKNHKIQTVFVLDDNIKKTTAQDAAGIIERRIDYNYKMQDYMPVKRPYELKTNEFPMQNFVCTNDVSVLTKGLHEYEVYKNELRICLLRSTGTISNPKNPARAIPAGPDLKIPNAQCLGTTKGEFALLFGNYKKAFLNCDIFYSNFVALDGEYKKEINIKLDDIEKDCYIYGINQGKKILYNYKNKKVSMI